MPELSAGEMAAAMESMTAAETETLRELMKVADPSEIETFVSFWHFFPGVRMIEEELPNSPAPTAEPDLEQMEMEL